MYDCAEMAKQQQSSSMHPWLAACDGPRQRYASGSQKRRSMSYSRCRGERWNASRALQLLDHRTVIVTGDSMTLNLYCALTCALMQAPNATVRAEAQAPLANAVAQG